MRKRRNKHIPTDWEALRAWETLQARGATIVMPEALSGGARFPLHSIGEVAKMMGLSEWWIRTHLDEFPGMLKTPGGDIRIPHSDVIAALDRWHAQSSNGSKLHK